MMDRCALPPALPGLVASYAGRQPEAVRYRAPSWELADVPGRPTRLVVDPAFTAAAAQPRYRAVGDRVVTAEAVTEVCSTADLNDDESVIAAFVLVMAWGSGTSNSRSLNNTRTALQDVRAAARVLRDSAWALRAVAGIDSPELVDSYRGFSLPGVQEPFFTKWFSFAGRNPQRAWQPLILDSRVRATLNTTLDVWLNHLTAKPNDPHRYIAYLTVMHRWAAELPHPTTAPRLEWIFFTHNGKPASAYWSARPSMS